MAATGFTWFLGNFAQVDVAPVAWVAIHTLYLHRGPLVHLVLTYPSGRPESPLVRGAVVVGYAVAIITPIWRSDGATILLAALLLAVSPANMSGRSANRRARRIALQATAGLSLVLSGTAAARLVLPQAMPVVRRCSCTRRRCACRRAAGGSADRPVAASGRCRPRRRARRGTVGHAPRRAVPGARRPNAGDRLLAVGPVFIDAEGRVLPLPDAGSGRSVTVVEREGQPVAVLVHDPAVLEDPGLLEAVSSAAQLAASNARLQAEVQARVVELEASRRRILETRDEERRLERRVHDRAERRLEELAVILRDSRRSATGEGTRNRSPARRISSRGPSRSCAGWPRGCIRAPCPSKA